MWWAGITGWPNGPSETAAERCYDRNSLTAPEPTNQGNTGGSRPAAKRLEDEGENIWQGIDPIGHAVIIAIAVCGVIWGVNKWVLPLK